MQLTTSRLAKTLVTSPQRSELMSRVRDRGTASEKAVRRLFVEHGAKIQLNVGGLPGKPDIVVPAARLVVFVHGCFWHRHRGCDASTTPKTNQDFWNAKFLENKERDQRNVRALRRLGYRVLVVWECQTKHDSGLDRVRSRIARGLCRTAR